MRGGPAAGIDSPVVRFASTPSEVVIRGINRMVGSLIFLRNGFNASRGRTHALTALEANCGFPSDRLDNAALASAGNSIMVASRLMVLAGPSTANFNLQAQSGIFSITRCFQLSGLGAVLGIGKIVTCGNVSVCKKNQRIAPVAANRSRAIVRMRREGDFMAAFVTPWGGLSCAHSSLDSFCSCS